MHMEDRLIQEVEKVSEVIKARERPLQDKLGDQKKLIEKQTTELADLKKKQKELQSEIKFKDEQVLFFKKENGRKSEEKNDMQAKLNSKID